MVTLAPVRAAFGLLRAGRHVPARLVVLGYAVGYLVLGCVLLLGQSSPLPGLRYFGQLDRDLDGPAWIDQFARWDSDWYLAIAVDGYHYIPGQQSPVAFFPAYPLLVRAAVLVLGDPAVAGHLVSLACGVGAVLLFRRWALSRMPGRAVTCALLCLVLYPFGVYLYGMVYGDALFIAASIGAFLMLERDHLWAAGLLGAVATAGRPVGIAVTLGLLVRVIERRAEQHRPGEAAVSLRDLRDALCRLRARDLIPAASVAGLVGWMAYLWVSFGDPLAFVRVEDAPGWGQGVGPSTWFKDKYVDALLSGSSAAPILTINAVAALGVAALVPLVRRRLGWAYAAFTAVAIAIPLLGTSSFIGCGRYALAAFPAFAALGGWLADRRAPTRRSVLGLSAGGLLLVTYAVGMGVLAS